MSLLPADLQEAQNYLYVKVQPQWSFVRFSRLAETRRSDVDAWCNRVLALSSASLLKLGGTQQS